MLRFDCNDLALSYLPHIGLAAARMLVLKQSMSLPSVESGVNACLSDRDCLLLHCLMDGCLVLDVHLVKLVDTADSVVSEHESSCLDAELA